MLRSTDIGPTDACPNPSPPPAERSAFGILDAIAGFAEVALGEPRRPRSVSTESHDAHLLAAESWLCRAQDASGDGGVSYGYTIKDGWRASYPETSGYIAPTFFRLASRRGGEYRARAERIVRWLLRIQHGDGSFGNPRFGPDGIVFDTGQVLFGLVSGHAHSGDDAVLTAARRAASWLCEVADADSRWTRNEHLDTPHVYNTRTAWALMELNAVEFDARRDAVARANLEWALESQRPSGFFDHCAFRAGADPFTHTIAYAAQGLLEAGRICGDERYVAAARRCAEATLPHLREDGFLPSIVSADGKPRSSTCCLTGNCQFAIVWARLFELDRDLRYRDAACKALDYVMATQDLTTRRDGIRGGIRGSRPVWGPYAPWSFPNWAAKFFVDAMWMRSAWGV
jgi:hypothetical protein